MSLWPLAIGVASAAVAAGTITVPAARRFAFGSVEFDWLGRELEMDRIDPDNITVKMKSGAAMRVFRLGGIAYDTKPESEQSALHQGRVDFIHACAQRGVILRTFAVKRHRELTLDAIWPSPALQEIGDAEAARYRQAHELRWFLTLHSDAMHLLEEADEKVRALLAAYRPLHLRRPSDRAKDCPLTGFLNYLVCGDLRDDLRAVSSNISANLQAASPVFDKATGEFTICLPSPLVHRMLAVSEWPDLVSGHLLHELMSVAGEIEVSQVCVPLSRDRELLFLRRGANNPFASEQERAECHAAAQLLSQGKTSRLSTQLAITLRAPSQDALERLTAQVSRILGNRRVTYSVQTKEAPIMWFNRLAERDKLVRPVKLFAENVAAIWPYESAPSGLARSQYGDGPVRTFMTGALQPYAFQFHCTDKKKALGNFLVFAPAGSGKSTLILHLLGGLAKFPGIRSFVFDSKEGARFMIEALGGLYQSFDKLALNPLDAEDTSINRQRLTLLIRSMLGDAGQADGIEDVLSHVVETAFGLPVVARTFDQVFPLTFPARTDARRAFSRWVTDPKGREGLYAKVFNAPRDSLSGLLSRSYLTGINMNEALDDPNLGAPVVAHVANAIERMTRHGDARGFALFIDEAAKLVRNTAFCDLAAEWYREIRKLGGAVGMAFQDPGALHKSGIADAVIENTASFFFFPNPQGSRAAYEPFNLNDEQKGFIFGAPEGRKVLLLKRDAATGFEESTILNIDLDPLGAAKRFYRSGPDVVRELQAIQERWGDEWLAKL